MKPRKREAIVAYRMALVVVVVVCVCVRALEPYLVRRFGGRRNTRGQRREKSDDDQGIAVLEKNKEKKRELWCYFWQH